MAQPINFDRIYSWIHKRSTHIQRILSALLTAALLICIFVGAKTVMKLDKERMQTNTASGKSPLQADLFRDYGEKGFRVVKENQKLVLMADMTTAEIAVKNKSTGEIWYSNPQDRENDEIVAIQTRLASQLVITCINKVSGNATVVDNANASIRQGGMEHQLIENGIVFTFSFPNQGVIVPVKYTLLEDGFHASVELSEIKEVWSESSLLQSVELLPFFGCGGLQDDGYILVPDGSGCLMNFNNGKERYQIYQEQIYGKDKMIVANTQGLSSEQIYMPVFGIKKNNGAFLAVVSEGDCSASIVASASRKTTSYNQVYAKATYRNIGRKEVANSSPLLDIGEPILNDTAFEVSYFMLRDDQSDYSGMANRYRQYLTDTKQLNQNSDADCAPLSLELYGAVSIEKYVMGIKKDVKTPLTSYQDAVKLMKQLREAGVEDYIVNYAGALEGGLKSKLVTKASAEHSLGGKSGFAGLQKYCNEQNVKLYIEWNPLELFKSGNGYVIQKDSAMSYFDNFAYQYKYALNTGVAEQLSRWYLLKPTKLKALSDKFFSSAKNMGIRNLSIAGMGEYMYSDSQTGKATTREASESIWNSVLESAGQKTGDVLVHGGNAYSYPYSDVILDVPSSGSMFDMLDQSVPFYQMVLRGSKELYTKSINYSSNYQNAFLEAVETGCGLKYSLIYGDVNQLLDTQYNDFVGSSFNYWRETIADQYKRMRDLIQSVGNSEIVQHCEIQPGVRRTTYANGTQVFVNYNDSPYQDGSVRVSENNFLIIHN